MPTIGEANPFWLKSSCTNTTCRQREAQLMDSIRILRQQLIESLQAQGELFNLVGEINSTYKDPS